MKYFYYLFVFTFVIVMFSGCANNETKGEVIHVQKYNNSSGYKIYIRDAEPSEVTTILMLREAKVTEPDKIDDKKTTISPIYYYRSSNPYRLTRIRLRRFKE